MDEQAVRGASRRRGRVLWLSTAIIDHANRFARTRRA